MTSCSGHAPPPLTGLKVLDLSRVLAGPWAGQILADLGADVIKVERPGQGDDTRSWGPPFLTDPDGRELDAAYYLAANRNKRSIAIDLTQAEGQALVRQLAGRSDVLIENFKVGGLKAYGLDYAALAAAHPGLVYCSITGFGQTGPRAAQAGYDFIIQGMAGLMSITGAADGPPMKTGVAVSDLTTGMYAVIAILAALRHRDATGEGQHIDMALMDTQLAWLANQTMNHLIGGQVPQRRGNAHPNIVPYEVFAASDGHLIVAVGNDRQFARFCAAIEAPDLAADPRFATNRGRVEAREVLVPRIAAILRRQTRAVWLDRLAAANIPHGPINDIAQALGDEQVKHRGLAVTQSHPRAGALTTIAQPMHLSRTPPRHDRPPPMLGEHSDEILRDLGVPADQLAALRRAGVVA
ncbi:MAG: CaiB/BaiF CoA transferase family protein [Rhodothalassiaceae bacterium]